MWQHLLRTETWTEKRSDTTGLLQAITVTAEVWTEALQADLDVDGHLHIPAREKPHDLDGPLVLKSGEKLTAGPKAEIRLKPGSNTCMVRNEHLIGFADKPVPADTSPDTDISIEGGIWTTLATSRTELNGNWRGNSATLEPEPGTHGVIMRLCTRGSDADFPIEYVVRVLEQKPNRDYPKTTPKGGTGKGIWIR